MKSFDEMPQIDPRDPEVSQRNIRRRAQDFREELPTPGDVVAEAGGPWRFVLRVFRWMVGGFRENQANDLAAAVAFYALLAIVPTVLALISVVGFFLRTEDGYAQAVSILLWIVPDVFTGDSVEALPRLRDQSEALGIVSLVGFLWIGSTFFAALGRAMNRVYGVPERSAFHQRLWGFIGIISFSVLFTVAVIAAIVPTALLGIDEQELPLGLERWAVFTGLYRVASYLVALVVAIGLFGVIFRVVPNARQKVEDIVPGALVIAVAFVILAQAFPLYLRVVSDWNLIGGAAGLLSLVLIWFYVLAHMLLFGAYINATWQRWRHHHAQSDPLPTSEAPERKT